MFAYPNRFLSPTHTGSTQAGRIPNTSRHKIRGPPIMRWHFYSKPLRAPPFPDVHKLRQLRSMLETGKSDMAGVLPLGEARNKVLQLLLFQSPKLSRDALEQQIIDAFRINHESSPRCTHETFLLSEAIGWIKQIYGNSLRKDGKTLSVCHVLSVARDIAVCGGSVGAIMAALFHDLREDYNDKKIRTCEIPRNFNLKIAGHTLTSIVKELTYSPPSSLRHDMDEYAKYLNKLLYLFGLNPGLLLITLKSFDGLENAKTIFDGIPDLSRHISKAIINTRTWKKLNRDVYAYMVALLRSKHINTHFLPVKDELDQIEANQSGVKICFARGAKSGNFIQSLPNDGTNVITIYGLSEISASVQSSAQEPILVRYSSARLPKEVFHPLLLRHFGPDSKIEEKQSIFMPTLPLLRNPLAYFFQITPSGKTDLEEDVAFFRHVHKLALFYPKYFLNSPALLGAALSTYGWLWRKLFHHHTKSLSGGI